MLTYKQIKRWVLVLILGTLCFVFGYIYFGARLAGLISGAHSSENSSAGPPAPIMKQLNSLRERIAANPKDEEAYTELGHLYFQANKFDQALAFYEKAVQLDGKDIVARNDLALCYHIAKNDKEALQQLETALRLSPQSQHLWLTLGLVTYESGQTQRAKEALDKAVQLDPSSEAAREARSMLSSLRKGDRSP